MSYRLLQVMGLTVALLFAPHVANASTIGYYLSGNTGIGTEAEAAITASGNTAQALTGLAAADLGGLDVVWILNGINGTPDANVINNEADLEAFIMAGGVLSFHDRNVDQGLSASEYLPGSSGILFTGAFSSNIDISTGGTGVTNGPGGVIDDTTLDGGNLSNHGWAELGSLPAGAVPIFNNGDAGQIVDFVYPLGLGFVYYSSIPLDFYLGGGGFNPPGDAFRNIYALNELAFQASPVVPEPASLLLFGAGLAGIAARARARRQRKG